MNILCLYNNDCALDLFNWIKDEGHIITINSGVLDAEWCKEKAFDLTVSYTYRYILSEEVLSALNNNVVNLHNSLLPFNRGADPNLWSIVEGTPRGVTLHYMDSKLDKGYIIAQNIVNDTDTETLKSSYYNLDREAKKLFKDAFKYYDYWPHLKKKAEGKGTYHALKDAEDIKSVIDSYDISIDEFLNRLKKNGVV